MGLSGNRLIAAVAVSDMDRAREFYEGKLGLSGGKDRGDGGHTYPCGDGTELHVYPSSHAGGTAATIAAWTVDDIDAAADGLTAKGVTFEQYGEPFNTNEKGIATFGDESVAWFKDPDGNTFAIETG